jgi:type I site-specific restriction endonuclease
MSFLEEFVNSVNYLPGEVCRSLELLKLLDEKAKIVADESQTMSSDYFSSLKKESGGIFENSELLSLIRDRHQKALNFSEEKVAVAKQLLDMVEFHLSRLKQDLDSYKKDISADLETAEERNLKKVKLDKSNSLFESDYGIYMESLDMQDDMQGEDNKVYCYCGKGSYGEMIECEGPKVSLI